MFASFLKKSYPPKVAVEAERAEDLQAIGHEDEESNSTSIIYYMPRTFISSQKTFKPEEWSLDNFQIGRHIGKGK
jgi:hypothetical protein